MRHSLAASLALGLLSLAGLAHASERLAVVLLVEGDPDMSDGLTEIAIARLAEQRGDLVGLRELRGRLPAAVHGERIEACLAAGRCLSELAQASGAEHAVIGRMSHAPDGTWRLELGLADTRAGTVAWRAPRSLPAETDKVVAGLGAAIDELMSEAPPPPAPSSPPALSAPAAAPAPAVAPPGLVVQNAPAAPPAHRARRIVGWSLGGLAAATVVTAAVLGHSAEAMPTGATRGDAQADLHRRENEATAANGLWIAGGVLGAVAAGVLVWRW